MVGKNRVRGRRSDFRRRRGASKYLSGNFRLKSEMGETKWEEIKWEETKCERTKGGQTKGTKASGECFAPTLSLSLCLPHFVSFSAVLIRPDFAGSFLLLVGASPAGCQRSIDAP